MLVHEPVISRQGGTVRVSARIESPGRKALNSADLWFDVSEDLADALSDRADPFLVAMLPIAQTLGETLEVRGVVSARLLDGAREFQHIHAAWWPRLARVVEIIAPQIVETEQGPGEAVGMAFSGGVDSFFTLQRHLAEEEPIPGSRVTHALMINGFDLDDDVDETGYFAAVRDIYEPMVERLGVELVSVRTNLRALRTVGLGAGGVFRSFGTAIIATSMTFGRLFRRFYLPGSASYRDLPPDGAHPMTDHLLSTESFLTVHDGAGTTRFEKLARLADWPETWSKLRVCWNRDHPNVDPGRRIVVNCGLCNKCIRTMTTLAILDVLPRYETFARPLERGAVRRARCENKGSWVFLRENLAAAVERGNSAMTFDLRWCLARNRAIDLLRRLRGRL